MLIVYAMSQNTFPCCGRGCGGSFSALGRGVFFTILVFFALALFPADALAWGPGVHMVTGNWVLQNLSALPLSVAAYLMQYPGQFLHGCLSADIFIGKGSVAKEGHSHNWSSGFSLLDMAKTPQSLAYAWGYLAHLAADTVAHNVYVPQTLHTAPGAGKMAHVYLEVQADRLLTWDSSDAVGVFYEAGSRETDMLLRSSMGQKAFGFWLKKHMFESSISIGGSKVWRTTMRLLDALVPARERGPLVEEMLALSTRAIFSLLSHPDTSPVLTLDPIGANALALANIKSGEQKLLVRPVASRRFRPLAGRGGSLVAHPDEKPLEIALPESLASIPAVCVPMPVVPSLRIPDASRKNH